MILHRTIRAHDVMPGMIFCEQRQEQGVVGIVNGTAYDGVTPIIGILCAGNNSPYWYVADSIVRIKQIDVTDHRTNPAHRLGYG